MTAKQAGAQCPSCGAAFTAETVLITGEAKWSCSCGAGGPLTGRMPIQSKHAPAPAPAPAPVAGSREKPHKHWSGR